MWYFADDAGTPVFKAIEGIENSSNLLFYGAIIFALPLLALAIGMLLVRKKFMRSKHKDYVDLP